MFKLKQANSHDRAWSARNRERKVMRPLSGFFIQRGSQSIYVRRRCGHCDSTQIFLAHSPLKMGFTYWCWDCGSKDRDVFPKSEKIVEQPTREPVEELTLSEIQARQRELGQRRVQPVKPVKPVRVFAIDSRQVINPAQMAAQRNEAPLPKERPVKPAPEPIPPGAPANWNKLSATNKAFWLRTHNYWDKRAVAERKEAEREQSQQRVSNLASQLKGKWGAR